MFNNFHNYSNTSNLYDPKVGTYTGYGYQPMSNIIRVTSLEEAIMRTHQPGSDMIYIHQDKDILYRVKVDADGKKSWGEFPIIVAEMNDNSPATRSDIRALTARVEALEKLNRPSEEVPDNVESV